MTLQIKTYFKTKKVITMTISNKSLETTKTTPFADFQKFLVRNEDLSLRLLAARNGYGLEVLINDLEPEVRIEVAKRNYGLAVLATDLNWEVRLTVARQGFRIQE